MIQSIRKKLLMSLAVLFVCTASLGKEAYKGQLHVSGESFTLQGSLLRVQFRVSYSANLLNRGETLNFTPVIKSNYQHQPLSSVVITHKPGAQMRLRGNVPVVSRSKTNSNRYNTYHFDYDTTIPYADWMAGAKFYVESEERSGKGKGHIYEDLLFSDIRINTLAEGLEESSSAGMAGLPATSAMVGFTAARPEWIQFVDPSEQTAHKLEVRGTIPLADERKIGAMGTNHFCEAIGNELSSVLEQQLQVAGTTVTGMSLAGYGVPGKNFRWNEKQWALRALCLKNYLLDRGTDTPNNLQVTWKAEDWDSIRALVANSQFRLRTAALDIIDHVDVAAGRERQLRMLDGGALFESLEHNLFPQLQRIEYVVTLQRQPAGRMPATSQQVSLHNLYASALQFEKGSRDSNDLLDLSARLFPSSPEAAINAAGVALMRGNLELAGRYLAPYHTDTRAYCNLGVYYLLSGNRQKADVYLQMARAQGVNEAAKALQAVAGAPAMTSSY